MDLALRRAWATLQSDGPTAKTPRGPSGLVPAGRWGVGFPWGMVVLLMVIVQACVETLLVDVDCNLR